MNIQTFINIKKFLLFKSYLNFMEREAFRKISFQEVAFHKIFCIHFEKVLFSKIFFKS